jgi:hypothetical protein
VGLVANILPEQLTVGIGTRRRGEPVIKLLEACDVDARPFLDPAYESAEEREIEYLTPQSNFEPIGTGEVT